MGVAGGTNLFLGPAGVTRTPPNRCIVDLRVILFCAKNHHVVMSQSVSVHFKSLSHQQNISINNLLSSLQRNYQYNEVRSRNCHQPAPCCFPRRCILVLLILLGISNFDTNQQCCHYYGIHPIVSRPRGTTKMACIRQFYHLSVR